ncbi:response regulator [uncultured Cohaesibacter sp.]|uniref:response regulator n=1 Tax=uncultured Cohaesibacter sp. TaxID=1002546 RepID=UPI002A0A7D0A|nr:response regulator [uncultured Cohaesibacter sp.]
MLDGFMEHQAAYGLSVESLDIVIVDDSKSVLTMIRSMISSMKVARVRSYDRGDVALHAIMHEPPNVIVTDLNMAPMSGMQLLSLIRNATMDPLCYIPVIVVTAHATEQRVAKLFETGAHHVLAKPMSSAAIQQRIASLCTDKRLMRLDGDRYVIDGMEEVLEEKRSRLRSLAKARQFHEQTLPQARRSQRDVDRILHKADEEEEFVDSLAKPSLWSGRGAGRSRKEPDASPTSTRPSRSPRFASVGGRRR